MTENEIRGQMTEIGGQITEAGRAGGRQLIPSAFDCGFAALRLRTAIVEIVRRRRRFFGKEINRGTRGIHGSRTGRKSLFRVFRVFRGLSLLPPATGVKSWNRFGTLRRMLV